MNVIIELPKCICNITLKITSRKVLFKEKFTNPCPQNIPAIQYLVTNIFETSARSKDEKLVGHFHR